jgi:hypothetical protein
MRRLLIGVVIAMTVGCGGDDDGNGPSGLNITGTFTGQVTSSNAPGVVANAVLQLVQNGTGITGTYSDNLGRTANVTGTLSGSHVDGTATYTDACAGSATSDTDVSNGGNTLTGTFSANDCFGVYTGGFTYTKQ